MSTMTFKVTLSSNRGSNLSINIIGTNLNIDYGDGTTTTQEPNTERIEEKHSFSNNDSIEKTWTVTVTGNITGLGYQFLYYGGSRVTEITLPEGLQTIEDYCLSYISCEEVIIPSTVTSIGTYFLYQSNVKKVVFLTKNLTTIGGRFLQLSGSVEFVKLPEGLTSFSGIYNFYDCTSLSTLEAPSTLTSFPSWIYDFRNVQLKTLKMNGGPIPNPPITEDTKIIIPLNQLTNFLNHSSYPDERGRYGFYGETLAEKIYISGVVLAENLSNQDVSANVNEGLTSLANKILDIGDSINKTLTYQLDYRDTTSTLRGSQFSALLLANNEVIGGCLLPRDNNVTTQSANIFAYKTIVPAYDINNNEIDYTWKPLNDNINYDMENIVSSNNTHTTTLRQIWFTDPCSHTPNLSSYNNGNIINLVGGCTSGTINYDNTEQAYRLDRTGSSRNNTWYIMFPITALHGKHGVIIEADIKSKHVAYNRIGFGCTDNERYIISNIGHDTWSSALRFSYGDIGNVSESGANYSFPDNDTIWYHCKFIADNDNYRCEIYDIDQTSLLVSLEQTYELLNEERIYGIAIGCPSTSAVYVKNIKCLHI